MTKVLVIEDDEVTRNEIVDWLTDEGYETTGISEVQAGVEYVLRNHADLIVYDIARPLLDGYGVWLEVHAHLAAAQIPFIFVTAGESTEDIRKGMALGADHYLTKPFDRQELVQAIQTRLQKTTAQAQKHQRDVEKLQMVLTEERDLRMLNAKMIAMFSHDFRNPLMIILTANQLLRGFGDRMDEARRHVHMARIEVASNQLIQMLDDMLVLAQMDVGKLDYDPEPLPISQFLEQIVEEFQILHDTTHRLLFESHFTSTVLADPRLLRQIVANLMSNALKYSPQGGEVRVTLDGDIGKQYIFTVQDQGIGIPPADQEHLFDAFVRGSNVSTITGSGLGLAIVKQAVEQHGGTIQLESESGLGTTIHVTIPCEPIPNVSHIT